VFLDALQAWTAEHRSRLEADGVEVVLSEAGETPKPSQWLTLRTRGREAEVGVWASGECETTLGPVPPDPSEPPELTHHDLTSAAELIGILNNLADAIAPRQ
jgi:hypothetical protein